MAKEKVGWIRILCYIAFVVVVSQIASLTFGGLTPIWVFSVALALALVRWDYKKTKSKKTK